VFGFRFFGGLKHLGIGFQLLGGRLTLLDVWLQLFWRRTKTSTCLVSVSFEGLKLLGVWFQVFWWAETSGYSVPASWGKTYASRCLVTVVLSED
jgi:hypothetical protein